MIGCNEASIPKLVCDDPELIKRLALRTSGYVIYVRLPDGRGFMLVHGYTGAVDVVSCRVADSLRRGRFDLLGEVTLEKLKRRGYVTALSKEREMDHVRNFSRVLMGRTARFVNLAIVVAYDCNLRCPYCFEQNISGNGWTGESFDTVTTRLAFEAMEQLNGEETQGKKIILYGGEPLMSRYSGIVRSIVGEATSRGYRISAITNGHDLDAFGDLIGPAGIRKVQISVDGGRDEHDRRRVLLNGYGTYDKIMSNIVLALRLGTLVDLRINLDGENPAGPESLAADLKRLGLYTHPNLRCHISLTRQIVGRTHGDDLSQACRPGIAARVASNLDGNVILRRLEAERNGAGLLSAFVFPGDRLKDHIKEVISTRKGFGFRGAYCSAGIGNFIFDPRGDIYTCWETVGEREERVGRFIPRLALDVGALSLWQRRTTPKCLACKYVLLCGGGCAMSSRRESGTVTAPSCDGFPARFQTAAREACAESTKYFRQ